jgi:Bacteriophage holin of superfamily 6 (Holin_LLH)
MLAGKREVAVKKSLIMLATFVIACLLPALAFGQPCSPVEVSVAEAAVQQQEWWMVLLDALVQLTAPLVTGILGVLGAWLVRKLTKKWEVEKQEKVLRLTDGLITSGVAFAEEQARKALRVGDAKTAGAEKMQAAVDYVKGQLDMSGLANVGQDELIKLIESKLHQERARPDGIVADTGAPESVPTPIPADTTEETDEKTDDES